MFAERYGQYGTTPLSSLWANSENRWSPQFCRSAGTNGYVACPLFQDNPKYQNATDASGGGQAIHTGAMMTCLGDGSVRGVNPSISLATWQQACNPQDGVVLGSDW